MRKIPSFSNILDKITTKVELHTSSICSSSWYHKLNIFHRKPILSILPEAGLLQISPCQCLATPFFQLLRPHQCTHPWLFTLFHSQKQNLLALLSKYIQHLTISVNIPYSIFVLNNLSNALCNILTCHVQCFFLLSRIFPLPLIKENFLS